MPSGIDTPQDPLLRCLLWSAMLCHSGCVRSKKPIACHWHGSTILSAQGCPIQRSKQQTDFRSTLSNEEHFDWDINDESGCSGATCNLNNFRSYFWNRTRNKLGTEDPKTGWNTVM